MVPQCDSLEGNAKSFGAKINKSEKNMSILSNKTKQNKTAGSGAALAN